MKVVVLFLALVILGGFGVLVLNNKITEPKQVPQNILTQITDTLTPTPTTALTEFPQSSKTATIKTNKGDIELELYTNDAPNTVVNFVQKAKSGFYNNLTIHRVEDWVVQGGDPLGDGTGGGTMPTELNNKPFVVGSLGVARGQDIKVSNDAQFFITKQDASWLNNQYTNFGIVTKGMDVVQKLQIGDKIKEVSVE